MQELQAFADALLREVLSEEISWVRSAEDAVQFNCPSCHLLLDPQRLQFYVPHLP